MMRKLGLKWLLILAVAVFMLSGVALADFDLDRSGSISVRIHTAEGTDVPGAVIEMYHVGSPIAEGSVLRFELTASFAGSGISLNDLSDSSLAQRLLSYALEHDLTAYDSQSTQDNGVAAFENVPVGLYLVRQNGFSAAKKNFTEIEPFLVMLPVTREGEWVYAVEAQPKVKPVTEPTPTPAPTEPPSDSNLPQTGLQRWPILALAIGGLVLFALGWGLCFVRKGKKDA